jgi:hypothetical protein
MKDRASKLANFSVHYHHKNKSQTRGGTEELEGGRREEDEDEQ